MGDMADFCNEQIWDDEDARGEYFSGRMSDLDAYERGIIDEQGYIYSSHNVVNRTCKCCGKTGLHWEQVIRNGGCLSPKASTFARLTHSTRGK